MINFFLKFFMFIFLMGYFTGVSFSHHSAAAFYDLENMVDMEGQIVSFDWRNPHVFLQVAINNSDGEEVIWEMESGSINTLQRYGIDREDIKIGEKVNIVGALSRHGLDEMLAITISSESMGLVAVHPNIAKRFLSSVEDLESLAFSSEAKDRAEESARGIFKVWTPERRPNTNSGNISWPLTPAAQLSQASWNPLIDDPALKCIPPGLPAAMDNPYPVEFREEDGAIVMYLEEWDGRRVFNLDQPFPISEEYSSMGYSLASWAENTLLVKTTKINYPFFDDRGTPLSLDAEILEEFTLSSDESNLEWVATIIDPVNFTEPVILEGNWIWLAGESVEPYNCTL